MMLCSPFKDRVHVFLRDYDRLQSSAVILIYIQIGCSLIGSLGALYNGLLLVNLVISLFALVAIGSSSQSLGRTYAVLLFCAILLDISWFILFSHAIWNISSESYGALFVFSVKLTLAMQIIGFFVRLSSSLLWIQMYRLGISSVDSTNSREADFDIRNSFLNPTTPEAIGGSIYDPTYYSSLFEDQEIKIAHEEGQNHGLARNGSPSGGRISQLTTCLGRSFQAINEEESLLSKSRSV